MRIGPVLIVLAAVIVTALAAKPQEAIELAKRCAAFKFDQWTDPTLRHYLQERGILAPGSSHGKLVRHAQSDCDKLVREVSTAAGTAKDEALARSAAAFDLAQRFKSEADATLAKAYTDVSRSAGDFYSQATTFASDHAENLQRTGKSWWDSAYERITPVANSVWDYARDKFAEQQPLRFQKEKMSSFKHAASSAASHASQEADNVARGFSSVVGTAYTQAHSAASSAASAIHLDL